MQTPAARDRHDERTRRPSRRPQIAGSVARRSFPLSWVGPLPCFPTLDLGQAVAGAGIEIEGIELAQVLNALERGGAEGSFAVEGVQHNAFQQVAQGHVVVLGERLEHFEDAFFHAYAGLDAFDLELGFCYHGTNVSQYIDSNNPGSICENLNHRGHRSTRRNFETKNLRDPSCPWWFMFFSGGWPVKKCSKEPRVRSSCAGISRPCSTSI